MEVAGESKREISQVTISDCGLENKGFPSYLKKKKRLLLPRADKRKSSFLNITLLMD